MGQSEEQRGLVGPLGVGELCGAAFVGQQQEAREVVAVGLDAALEDPEPVALGSIGSADGGRAGKSLPGDLPGAPGRVVALDDLHLRMDLQEIAALHQGDRMRMYLADLLDPLPGQGRKDM